MLFLGVELIPSNNRRDGGMPNIANFHWTTNVNDLNEVFQNWSTEDIEKASDGTLSENELKFLKNTKVGISIYTKIRLINQANNDHGIVSIRGEDGD